MLDKDEPNTWWGGGKLAPSNLDFVVARDHIPFKTFGGSEVSVRGWPKIAEPDEQLRWVREMSDQDCPSSRCSGRRSRHHPFRGS